MTSKLRQPTDWTLRQGLPGIGLLVCCLFAATGCGGGGDGGSSIGGGTVNQTSSSDWVPNQFLPAATFAGRCALPRAGSGDIQGSVLSENQWLRSWSNDLYLWYGEITDRNPAGTSTTAAYFDLLKTFATTASGAAKDKFHFTYTTAEWNALSQGGMSAGYGFEMAALRTSPPRQYFVAYLDPGYTPNVARGAQIMTVDGVDLVNDSTSAGLATLNAGLFPSAVGQSHTFTVKDVGSSVTRAVTLVSQNVTSTPVQNVKTLAVPDGLVGYIQFNDHIATAEAQLITAINTLKTAGVKDLVLDIRYNGGGYLDIASELAYMIAGAGPTAGRTFELTKFNDKHPSTDPVTNQAIVPVPFYSTSSTGAALPTLNLTRVFVLTGPSTCSASESIINGLLGANVQVIQIGSTTCGKPYGFYPQDNCGTTYFSIEFKGVNDKGFGDYTDGYSPANSTGTAQPKIAGCSVAEDFSHALGDAAEGRLSAALAYRSSATCGSPTGFAKSQLAQNASTVDGLILRGPGLENRLLRDR